MVNNSTQHDPLATGAVGMNDGDDARQESWRRWVKVGSLVAVGIVLFVLVRLLPVERFVQWMTETIENLGVWGPLVFALIYVSAALLFVPGSAVTLAAGLLFGLWGGTILVSAASTIAAALAFLIARYLARSSVEHWASGSSRFVAMDRAIGEGGWKIVALLRLSPAVPFSLGNYLFGLTTIRFWPYVLTSWLFMLPGTFMYVYLGYAGRAGLTAAGGQTSRGPLQWTLLIVGLMATVAVTIYVTRLARRAMRKQLKSASQGHDRSDGLSSDAVNDEPVTVEPMDTHNRALVSHAHPPDWINPQPAERYNLVVIGAGTAGLVAAAGAAGLGAKVALVERHLMGGDCLNVGCVPSKALIRCARAAAQVRDAGEFGVTVAEMRIDFAQVMERMRRLRASIAPHDSVARFQDLGIDVFLGDARFTGSDMVEAAGRSLRFARAVLATGARAAAPSIPGLADAGYLTNETIFSLTEMPDRLAIIGAGPIGCELAQTFARLGSKVSLIEAGKHIMPREDPEAAALVETALLRDGVVIHCGGKAASVLRQAGDMIITLECEGQSHELRVDEILVGVGRAPNVENIGLEAAGVEYDVHEGVKVNDFLQTTNRKVYAAGDVCSSFKFTHSADALARIVLRNALFFGRSRASRLTIPWCTYTDPEVAHVGLSERDAKEQGMQIDTIRIDLSKVDRAILDGQDEGFLKVHLKKGTDTILGATLVSAHAGEIISQISQAMTVGLGLGKIANVIHPYPTQAEVIKRAADAYNRTRLTPFVKRLFTRLMAWRR